MSVWTPKIKQVSKAIFPFLVLCSAASAGTPNETPTGNDLCHIMMVLIGASKLGLMVQWERDLRKYHPVISNPYLPDLSEPTSFNVLATSHFRDASERLLMLALTHLNSSAFVNAPERTSLLNAADRLSRSMALGNLSRREFWELFYVVSLSISDPSALSKDNHGNPFGHEFSSNKSDIHVPHYR